MNSFIVSASNNWFEKNSSLLLMNPYLADFYREQDTYVIPPFQTSEAEKQKRYDEVNRRYLRLKPYVAQMLNRHHGVNYPDPFWDKFLCFHLYRIISVLWDRFSFFEAHFDPVQHSYRLIRSENYRGPSTAMMGRHLFATSDFMQEQIFTWYVKEMHPNIEHKYNDFAFDESQVVLGKPTQSVRKRKLSEKINLQTVYRKFNKLRYQHARPRILITDTDIALEHMDYLYSKSCGKIVWNPIPRPNTSPIFDHKIRSRLNFEGPQDADRFDRLFAASIQYLLPATYVEYFSELFQFYSDQILSGIDYIVAEAWLSNEYLCLYLAMARLKGTRHIYCQHGMEEPFTRCMTTYSTRLCDIYLSSGWKDSEYTNLVPGAYFRRIEKPQSPRSPMMINVAYNGEPYLVEMSALDMFTGYGAVRYIDFKGRFLAALPTKILKNISYKPYPVVVAHATWDIEKAHSQYIRQMNQYSFDGTLKEAMQSASLTIIDCLGTVHNEALIQNSPVLIMGHMGFDVIKPKYQEDYRELAAVGIFHTDPVKAATFLATIADNPSHWWTSPDVQRARDRYVKNHFGPIDTALNYLLNL